MRSNSAKWNNHHVGEPPGGAAVATTSMNTANNKQVGQSYTGATISHKSPPAQHKQLIE